MIADVVAAVLLIGGALLALVAAAGLHRFDDVFTRMHAASKPTSLGLLLVAAGAAIQLRTVGGLTELALGVGFAFVTIPAGAHLLARAAYASGERPVVDSGVDELAVERDSAHDDG